MYVKATATKSQNFHAFYFLFRTIKLRLFNGLNSDNHFVKFVFLSLTAVVQYLVKGDTLDLFQNLFNSNPFLCCHSSWLLNTSAMKMKSVSLPRVFLVDIFQAGGKLSLILFFYQLRTWTI
jgi:hypothetical protein